MIAVALALAWLLGGPLIDARLGTHLADLGWSRSG